jgi:hypothetical protein
MTRPLRRAHHLSWLVLAVLLPSLFAASLIVRRDTTPRNREVNWELYR